MLRESAMVQLRHLPWLTCTPLSRGGWLRDLRQLRPGDRLSSKDGSWGLEPVRIKRVQLPADSLAGVCIVEMESLTTPGFVFKWCTRRVRCSKGDGVYEGLSYLLQGDDDVCVVDP
jgi:hypothetical protein